MSDKNNIPILFGILWLGISAWLFVRLFPYEATADWFRTAGLFVGGVGVAPLGLLLAHWRTTALSGQTENDTARRITNAFTKAVELLGSKSIVIRAGGIHALGHLALENEQYHPKIMDIIAAFIRHQSRREVLEMTNELRSRGALPASGIAWEKALSVILAQGLTGRTLPIDLEVACIVIRDRNAAADKEGRFAFDLSYSFLRGINFAGVAMRRVNFQSSVLSCRLHNADFSGANLRAADLSNSVGLTQEQVDSAKGNIDTKLPEGIDRPEHWSKHSDPMAI